MWRPLPEKHGKVYSVVLVHVLPTVESPVAECEVGGKGDPAQVREQQIGGCAVHTMEDISSGHNAAPEG